MIKIKHINSAILVVFSILFICSCEKSDEPERRFKLLIQKGDLKYFYDEHYRLIKTIYNGFSYVTTVYKYNTNNQLEKKNS